MTDTLTGTLKIITQVKNSANGNPRYICRVNETTFWTKPDSSLAYELSNYANRSVQVTLGKVRGRLSLLSLQRA